MEVCPQQLRSFLPLGAEELDRDACLRCGQCLEACTHGALELKGREITAGELADKAARLIPFFQRSGGGVTVTGGEPLMQAEFTAAVLQLCREHGIHTAVETTGYAGLPRLQQVAAVTNLFLFDLKHHDAARHQEFTGVPLHLITENLQWLLQSGAEVLIRVPLIPGYNGSPEDVAGIATLAWSLGAQRMSLLPFNPSTSGKYRWLQRRCPLDGVKPQNAATMQELEQTVREIGLEVVPP